MSFKGFMRSIVIGLPIGITIIDVFGYIARVDGVSMQPSLNPDSVTDYVFLNRWSVRFYEVSRGDVVSLFSPKDPDTTLIKRIVGLEGDIINTLGYKKPFVRVPEGHCWVEGDHVGHSLDSNFFGPVSVALITAKASAIVWPPRRWQLIESKLRSNRKPIIKMRAVRFVERLEFDFTGNIFRNAITLGDVDNDGQPELIVGNSSGDIAVFKGEQCWQKISGLGMITAVGVGDVMNCGSNALVVICGDGWCHIYLCLQSKTEETGELESQGKLQPVHVQRIPANTKILLVGDIDNDGNEELVMGLTDRVVRSYRWSQSVTSGKLVCLNKWECARQIGSVTLNRGPNGIPCLLVAQPGGTFMKIQTEAQNADKKNAKEDKPPIASVEYHPLTSNKMRNPNISTEIIGDIGQGPDKPLDKGTPYAVATLDGTLMLVQDEQVLWSIQVDHQLFALRKLDLTGDGLDEIVACSWDGQTYILDQKKHCVRFQLEESVAVFCAGFYSLTPSSPPVPCLIYTTFTNKIYIYYNVKLPSLASKSLITHIREEGELELLCGEDFVSDKKKLKKLIEWCLYNKHDDLIS